MPFTIIRNDITKLSVDAIVNAANADLAMGGGVCGAIFKAAGAKELQSACDKLKPIKTGESIITLGFLLPAKYVIHTAGPVYRDGKHGEEAFLRSCYVNSLNLAKENACKSIAFPLISSGIFRYPKDEALIVATNAISKWLMKNDIDVSLVVFDKESFSLSEKLLGDVKEFIDENYVGEFKYTRSRIEQLLPVETEALKLEKNIIFEEISTKSDGIILKLDEPFSEMLLRLIDTKGKTDVEVYKRANIDRKLFSKIRTGKGYVPSKKTVVALAVALELSLNETDDLLECAGFALSHSVMFDVIVEYFITQKRYDIFEINNVLFKYDQQILGG